jgi:hypothetical protein
LQLINAKTAQSDNLQSIKVNAKLSTNNVTEMVRFNCLNNNVINADPAQLDKFSEVTNVSPQDQPADALNSSTQTTYANHAQQDNCLVQTTLDALTE